MVIYLQPIIASMTTLGVWHQRNVSTSASVTQVLALTKTYSVHWHVTIMTSILSAQLAAQPTVSMTHQKWRDFTSN